MPTQRYRIDPDSGLVHLRDQYGESEGVPIEAVTMGTLGISSGYLYSHSGGITPRRIGTASESSINVYDNGTVEFISGIAHRNLGELYSTTTQYTLAGEITVLTQSGEERTITIERAPASRIGTSLLVRTGAEGQLEFYESRTKYTNLTDLNMKLPGDWRFATAEEARTRALIGYLKNNQAGAIRELIALGGINTAEGPITSMSGLIRYIAQFGYDSLITQSRTQYSMLPSQELDE